jgi:hypothetical protein
MYTVCDRLRADPPFQLVWALSYGLLRARHEVKDDPVRHYE